MLLCPPKDHKRFGLPPRVGGILLRLLESTKSSQDKSVDVVLAWRTSLGLCVGEWFEVCKALHPPSLSSFIFQDLQGNIWCSADFRREFVIPLLEQQRLEGDPYLTPYDGKVPGTALSSIFYSIHSYHRGGRSDASVSRPGSVRKATQDEIEEHGRWRTKNRASAEPIPLHYRS